MTDVETAWLAGMIEGEGYINVRPPKYGASIEMRITMTDEDVVRRMWTIAGVGNFLGPYQPANERHKPFWVWTVQRGDDVVALLKAVLPHLGQRRSARALEAIQQWEEREFVGSGSRQRARTHCANGHEFTDENTKVSVTKEGWITRQCRACGRERYHAKKRDALAPRCSVAECDAAAHVSGYCRKHYKRVQAHGDPHTVLVNCSTGVRAKWVS